MVRPSSRGGVPVLRRPSANPSRSSVRDRPSAGASPTRPAGVWRSPIWMRPRRNVPVVSTTRRCRELAPVRQPDARRPAAPGDHEVIGLALDHRQVGGVADRLLHGRGVKLAVGLGARPAHRRPLAPIEHAKLDAADDRRPAPSGRRARRSRAPDGPCRARRSRDCRTSRRWWRSGA